MRQLLKVAVSAALVLAIALTVAAVLNLRYKPLEVGGGAAGFVLAYAYVDTWTGKKVLCRVRAVRTGMEVECTE